jgi:hypothetical protein
LVTDPKSSDSDKWALPQLSPLTQLMRPLETLQLPQCYLSSAGSILCHLQTIAIPTNVQVEPLSPLGALHKVPDGCQMHMLICPHIIIAQFICTHRLCTPAIVPGGKCAYLLDYLQFDPLTSLPSTCVSMLRSITMPTKNFFPSSSLAPTHSSHYPFLYSAHKKPLSAYVTGTSLNCTIPTHSPILDSLSGMTLNCTFSIPVSWITHSSEPPRHSSHIAFIEDIDNTQHKVMCPAPQMYPCDGSHRGPDGPVACAPACFANAHVTAETMSP